MTDTWEPTAADRAAYYRGMGRDGTTFPAGSDALLDCGLREAFASLRARVGDPVPAQLINAAAEPVEYRAFYNPDELIAATADGWRFVAQCWDAAGDPYGLMQRPPLRWRPNPDGPARG